MPVYPWDNLPTRYFGNVFVTLARVQLQSTRGRFHSFTAQIDSGAVISLFSRSIGEILKIELESGRKVELTSVGGGTRAYVHELSMRFEKGPQETIPVAIAETDNVPTLLGRLGVFQRYEIHFNPRQRQTWVSDPLVEVPL